MPFTCYFIQKETDTRLSQFNCNTIEGKQGQKKLFKELLTLKKKNTFILTKKTTNGNSA